VELAVFIVRYLRGLCDTYLGMFCDCGHAFVDEAVKYSQVSKYKKPGIVAWNDGVAGLHGVRKEPFTTQRCCFLCGEQVYCGSEKDMSLITKTKIFELMSMSL
jgi:hypothetical protein